MNTTPKTLKMWLGHVSGDEHTSCHATPKRRPLLTPLAHVAMTSDAVVHIGTSLDDAPSCSSGTRGRVFGHSSAWMEARECKWSFKKLLVYGVIEIYMEECYWMACSHSYQGSPGPRATRGWKPLAHLVPYISTVQSLMNQPECSPQV